MCFKFSETQKHTEHYVSEQFPLPGYVQYDCELLINELWRLIDSVLNLQTEAVYYT